MTTKSNKQIYRTTSLHLIHTLTSIGVFNCFVWRIYLFLKDNKKQTNNLTAPLLSNWYIHIHPSVSFFCFVWRIYLFLKDNKKQTNNLTAPILSNWYIHKHPSVSFFFLFCLKNLFISQRQQKTNKQSYSTDSLQLIHTHTSISVFFCFVWRIYLFLKDTKNKQTILQHRFSPTDTYTYIHQCLFFLFCLKNLFISQRQQKQINNVTAPLLFNWYIHKHPSVSFFVLYEEFIYIDLTAKTKKQSYRTASLQLINTQTSISVFVCFVWKIYLFLKDNKKQTYNLTAPLLSNWYIHIHPSVSFLFCLKSLFISQRQQKTNKQSYGTASSQLTKLARTHTHTHTLRTHTHTHTQQQQQQQQQTNK